MHPDAEPNRGVRQFDSLTNQIGKFNVVDKTLLVPEMSRAGSRLLVAALRSFGIDARVMESYEGLRLGKRFTSGKECFPCQVTLGDVLHHMEAEKERLGDSFQPENYLYCMAETGGPCRFGMYAKLHRIVLDSLGGLGKTRIVSVTSEDSYAVDGMVGREVRSNFSRTAYLAIVIADVLDRMLQRTRPYEKHSGDADAHFEDALATMADAIEVHGRKKGYRHILRTVEGVAKRAREIIDPGMRPKPLIGIVGEIYLRSHTASNQDLIRLLESHGAEVVNASIAEWLNYVSHKLMRKASRDMTYAMTKRDVGSCIRYLKAWLHHRIQLTYQYLRLDQAYRRVGRHLHIHQDHRISRIERQLDNDRIFTFQVGTEAALGIGGALEYQTTGFDGIVNVFPFTCMPSTMCSAILKPILERMRVPYIDSVYDGTFQPNREAAIRTFMHQAAQHQEMRLSRRPW